MIVFLLIKSWSSTPDMPDLSEPAIGCEKIMFVGESKFR